MKIYRFLWYGWRQVADDLLPVGGFSLNWAGGNENLQISLVYGWRVFTIDRPG